MNCVLFKKKSMAKALPDKPDSAANPGEFGLVDNEDGTVTVVIVDPAGNPSPIGKDAAEMTVESSDTNVVEVEMCGPFTFCEKMAEGNVAPAGKTPERAPAPVQKHPPAARHAGPGAGAVADITAVVKWAGGTPAPHRLTWKLTVGSDGKGGTALERSRVEVNPA